jgi:tetratricopeptide (TPR) repeat protein
VLKHQPGQSDLAIEYIGRAVELEPAHAGMRSNLGNVFMESGRLAAAEACYLAAIELAPDFADAHCNLAVVLRAGRGRRAGRQSVGDREGIGASGRVESRTRGVDRLRPVPARVVFVCMSVPAPTPRPM